MLKAGILEIADVFAVNKADLDGADRTVKELREMVHMRDATPMGAGHHGPEAAEEGADPDVGPGSGASGTSSHADASDGGNDEDEWEPPIVRTVANTGEGVDEFLETLDDHRQWLVDSGKLDEQQRRRYAAEIRTLLREDVADLLQEEIDATGGLEQYVEAVQTRETDPYSVADEVIAPLEDCVESERE
jgi:LAO/AO transport system kinase